ncbi:unnamed protein product [Cylicocyclus nassatus]|uniref:DUF7758 domain-containing protein n=1 Tax=Cylicocyclus nassatus TaxID=53992 RepID=A0AA36H2N6_CYLNA|nr:unnamed protein product [Cylicocyclus nassatus]
MLQSAAKEAKEMMLKTSYLHKRLRKVKTNVLCAWLQKYKKCMSKLKRYLTNSSAADAQRKKSHAKLHPVPDRPIRRVASKLSRKPTNEIERLRKKGDNWTANDLFRFQYSDPEEGTTEERRELCYAWLDRLLAISKKYCYLAWYESAIYACYYRLAPIIVEMDEKRKIWTDVKREYAEIFLMGRRIWRRPSHPSRLRVLYDMAMLCVRFGNIEDDPTSQLFRESLADADNFDNRVLDEVEFAKSVDKVTLLENYVIDQFYAKRRSSGSFRGSFRSRRTSERSPSRKSTTQEDDNAGSSKEEAAQSESKADKPKRTPSKKSVKSLENAEISVAAPAEKAVVPSIQVEGPSRPSSARGNASPRLVHFSDDEEQVV